MSLMYNCWFAGPSPDLHQLLDQLVDEHLEEVPGEKYFYFHETNGTFYLYYSGDDGYDEDEDKDEDESLLFIYPSSGSGKYTVSFGDFEMKSSWFLEFNKRKMLKADEAFARLLRGALKQYAGDFVSLFNGEQVILYRTGGHVYLNASSNIAQEPMVSLLGLQEYELRTYKVV